MYLVLYLTLFGRPVYSGDPLGVVFGGWNFRLPEYGGEVHAFYNIFMLTPAIYFLFGVFPGWTKNFIRLLIIALLVSFIVSVVIEVSQVVFRVGTLQISDIVYNTVSGGIGAVIHFIIRVRLNVKTPVEWNKLQKEY
jgi:glycopeptide antibiotics resistance protein